MKELFALNPYIWKYRWHLLLGILFIIISNLFAVYPAQVVREALDLVTERLREFQHNPGAEARAALRADLGLSLLKFGGLVVLMALLRGIFLFFTRQTVIAMSRHIEYDLHRDLYDHFQSLSLSFYRRNRTGDLMARLTEDSNRVRDYLGPGIMYTINTISLAVIVLVTMVAVNPILTLYAILPLPLLSYLIYRVETAVLRRSDRVQQQLSLLSTFTQEIFSGIRVVKAYVKERETARRFAHESEDYRRKSVSLAQVDAVFFPSVIFLVGLSNILAIWVGGIKVVNGTLSLGNIAEFIIYIGLLTWPIIAIGWVTTLIQRAAASMARLNALFRERPEIRFPGQSPAPENASLVFDDVDFTYPETGIHALRGLSFSLKPGQKLGIVGPTGSGKSTLCAMIPRLFDVTSGEIRFGGHAVTAYSKDALRGAIGYAPQDIFLFSDSIANNIAFGKPGATQDEIEAAARAAGVYDNIMEFPQQFGTVVGERGVTLSGGQKQRISVARAWLRKPLLLILDDVLSAVDTHTEERILRNLRQYRQENPNSALVMTAHRISCIQDSDLILVMEHGAITAAGTHEELVQQAGYYQRIYQKQLLEADTAV